MASRPWAMGSPSPERSRGAPAQRRRRAPVSVQSSSKTAEARFSRVATCDDPGHSSPVGKRLDLPHCPPYLRSTTTVEVFMRALVCPQPGPLSVLELREVDDPKAARGHVVIDVHAAGVNFPDVLITQGLYQFKPPAPFTPGGEVAGTVVEVGEGVEGVAIGDRVCAIIPWGGFAEKVAAPAAGLIQIPEGMALETAAAFNLTYATSIHALRDRAQLQPGETVLVLGAAGGVGMASIDVAKAMGARVIAAASTDEKLAACTAAGADAVINYTTEDLKKRAKALTGGKGADVVVDPVGGAFSEAALRATAWRGRFLVIGFAAGDIPRIPLNLALLKGCAIVGVFWGSFIAREPALHARNQAQLAEWFASGQLKPLISGRYPLDRAVEALEELAGRRAQGKLVVTMR